MKALLYKTEKHVPTASGYTALENMETAGIITTYYLLGIPVYKSLKFAARCPWFEGEQAATHWERMMDI